MSNPYNNTYSGILLKPGAKPRTGTPYNNTYSGILLKAKAKPRTGMDKMLIGKPPGRQNQTGIPVTVAIFFDGTGNNRNNVAQRHMVQQGKQEEDGIRRTESFPTYGLKKDKKTLTNSSYAAGYSNVSILEQLNIRREVPQHEISLYVEGIGTTDDKADDTPGSGFGKGKTGVVDKVKRGIMLLAQRIADILKPLSNTYVNQITIDVFGFSRGAAAARHFVAQLRDAKHPLSVRLGTPEAKVTIKFVGLFDTVSSVGYGLGFGSNVKELGLDLGTEIPKKVVHLTAGNEYRKNFSLTDITSSLGVGYELTLPGVHSNIGGSYGEQEDEERRLHLWEREALIAQGWYTKDEAPIYEDPVYNEYGMQIGTTQWSVGKRKNLNQDYQFIPLRIMAENAKKFAMLLESLSGRYAKYAIAATHPLAPVQAAILSQIGPHGSKGRHALVLHNEWSQLPPNNKPPEVLRITPAQAVMVRHCYLRRSASIGFQGLADGLDRIGMGERRDKKNRPHRTIFPG